MQSFRAWALLCLAMVLLCAGQAAQTAAPQAAPPTLRITVTLVQVDAVVTDAHGQHVPDLQPDDFEILQDGEAQKITYFSYIPEEANSIRAGGKAPIGPPAPVTPGQVKRTVALVVDDLALSFANIVRVREALKKYVEERMQPGDLVALVRTGGGVAILEQFTTDRRVLLEAISLLKWRFSGRSGVIPIRSETPGPGPQADPQYLDYQYRFSALGALNTLEEVVQGMGGMPGRKSVVFLSDQLRLDPAINSAIDRLTDLSNRSAVSLYTVDPSGLRSYAKGLEKDISLADPSPNALPQIPPDFEGDEFRFQEGLSNLASRTGGLFFANRNDIGDCIRQATDDQLGYYLLGYSPREGTFESGSARAKFHRVVVRVHRRGLQVRWKSGFTGVPDELHLTEPVTARTREQQLMEALASPFSATGLKVRLTSMFTETKQAGPVVVSMLHFEAKDLSFARDADGVWNAAVDVVTSAYRGVRQPMQQRHHQQQIRLPDDAYRKALKEGFLYMLTDKMKEPGMFLMRAVVRDVASQRIGSASQFVQVPDTRKGQLALSGIQLNLADQDVLRDAGASPDAEQGQSGKVEAWSEGGPAVRRYRPGQSILYGYLVIHPRLKGSAKEARISCEVRVFRNGAEIYKSPLQHAVTKSTLDPGNYIGGGLLRLGGQLTPGEYLLQLVVTDEYARKKNSRATQWVDFEVTPA